MIRTFKCSGCGGDLIYQAGTEQMQCIRCGRTQPFSELDCDTDLTVPAGDERIDSSGDGLSQFRCSNCGAELKTDDYTASTTCSYCGSPMLIESRFTGNVKPARILPFGFDKKKAQENFRSWTGTGFLTPASFKSQATMDKVQGVYVPYWLYDYTADVSLNAMATRHRIERTQNEEIIHTDNFQVNRTTQSDYDDIPADAHSRLPSEALSILEPFDLGALKDFAEPYLAGFYADKYAKTAEELEPGIRRIVEQDALQVAASQIMGYDSVQIVGSKIDMVRADSEYVMLPVWELNFRYGGTNYPLYMNGRSGKIEGELPVSKGKLLLLGAIVFIIVFLLTYLFGRVL